MVASISVVGHASPRWRSADTASNADSENAVLARKRAEAVAAVTKRHLRELLPAMTLAFDMSIQVDEQLEGGPDLQLGSTSRGSKDTLVEAGPRGRTANDASMRRVELVASLAFAITTDVEEETESYEWVSSETRDWALRMVGEAGLSAVGKASVGILELTNKRLRRNAQYFVEGGGYDVGVGIQVAKAALSGATPFKTPEPMTFQDFHGARFFVEAYGVALGVGYEWATFSFESFITGKKRPRPFPIGGWTAGGAAISLGNAVYGAMFLVGVPRNTRVKEKRVSQERVQFVSSMLEQRKHVVHFETGSHRIAGPEDRKLGAYLATVAQPFRD